MELIIGLIVLVFAGLYEGIVFLVKSISKAFDRKKREKRRKQQEITIQQELYIFNLTKKYPNACLGLLKGTSGTETAQRYNILKSQDDIALIKAELQARISKKVGFNDTYLAPLSSHCMQIYSGESDKQYQKAYRQLFYDFFNHYYYANDYFICDTYKSSKFLTREEYQDIRALYPAIPPNLKKEYYGSFEDLSLRNKMFLVTNISSILDAYELYKKYATARKKLRILHKTCPRALDYICMKETGKSLKKYGNGIQMMTLDELTSSEAELVAKQYDYCRQLELEWDSIDYHASMTSGQELLPKGKLLEKELQDNKN